MNISINDYMDDPRLPKCVEKQLKSFLKNRRDMVIPEGCKLKRQPEDELLDRDSFNPTFVIAEFRKICGRTSKESSGVRKVIQNYVFAAMYNIYQVDEQEKLNKASKESNNGNEEESRS